MASPFLQYDDLVTLASSGGYSTSPQLSQLTSVFLLSSLTYLKERWLWQSPLIKISDTEYDDICAMVETARAQLMSNLLIGSILPTIAVTVPDNLLLMNGQVVNQADYPELTPVVPAVWLVGTTIVLPDMTDRAIFGVGSFGAIGQFGGANQITLAESEIPVHNHDQLPHSHAYTVTSIIPSTSSPAPLPGIDPAIAPAVTGLTTAVNQPAGGGLPHDNVPESLMVNYAIVAR